METTKYIEYIPQGVCARKMDIEINDRGIIKKVMISGGCSGNSQGIAALTSGMAAEHIIARLEGINCNGKGTSCPDQLARALKQYSSENGR